MTEKSQQQELNILTSQSFMSKCEHHEIELHRMCDTLNAAGQVCHIFSNSTVGKRSRGLSCLPRTL